jgi:hypothetical protein
MRSAANDRGDGGSVSIAQLLAGHHPPKFQHHTPRVHNDSTENGEENGIKTGHWKTVFAGADGIYMEATIDARKVVQYLTVRGGDDLVHLVAYGEKGELDSAMTAVSAIAESVALSPR